jgi:hypothetical protein
MSTIGSSSGGKPMACMAGASASLNSTLLNAARRAEHPDGHQDRHQVGHDANGHVEALLRAVHELLIDLDVPQAA